MSRPGLQRKRAGAALNQAGRAGPEKALANMIFLMLSMKVVLGEMYEMVYTSQMGLYRYRTGDIVKIVDFFGQSPVYEFQFR